jgi:hypothetical protein
LGERSTDRTSRRIFSSECRTHPFYDGPRAGGNYLDKARPPSNSAKGSFGRGKHLVNVILPNQKTDSKCRAYLPDGEVWDPQKPESANATRLVGFELLTRTNG